MLSFRENLESQDKCYTDFTHHLQTSFDAQIIMELQPLLRITGPASGCSWDRMLIFAMKARTPDVIVPNGNWACLYRWSITKYEHDILDGTGLRFPWGPRAGSIHDQDEQFAFPIQKNDVNASALAHMAHGLHAWSPNPAWMQYWQSKGNKTEYRNKTEYTFMLNMWRYRPHAINYRGLVTNVSGRHCFRMNMAHNKRMRPKYKVDAGKYNLALYSPLTELHFAVVQYSASALEYIYLHRGRFDFAEYGCDEFHAVCLVKPLVGPAHTTHLSSKSFCWLRACLVALVAALALGMRLCSTRKHCSIMFT